MNIMNLVVLAIVVTIFATITLASLSYAVFRLRDRRMPPSHSAGESRPEFFERVRFGALDPAALE